MTNMTVPMNNIVEFERYFWCTRLKLREHLDYHRLLCDFVYGINCEKGDLPLTYEEWHARHVDVYRDRLDKSYLIEPVEYPSSSIEEHKWVTAYRSYVEYMVCNLSIYPPWNGEYHILTYCQFKLSSTNRVIDWTNNPPPFHSYLSYLDNEYEASYS